jgi:TrpR-related protein YerC/YecD
LTNLLYFDKVFSMIKEVTKVWRQVPAQQLAEALASIEDVRIMQNFLRDVMTEKEIIEMSARLEAANLLSSGAKYTDIIKKTKLSSRTVARISDWLKNGCNGYEVAINSINAHQTHIPPAPAE